MAPKQNGIRSNPDQSRAKHEPAGSGRKHEVSTTDRPETPELEGLDSLPEELTGRASRTDENLSALFDSKSPKHLADGFHGGSGDDGDNLDQTDGPGDVPDEDEL